MKRTTALVVVLASGMLGWGVAHAERARSGKNAGSTNVAAAPSAPPVETGVKAAPAMETLSQTSGPWLARCLYPHGGTSGPALCTVQQRLVAQNARKQPVVMGAVTFSRERAAGASSLGPYTLMVELPQGLALGKPATIAVDGGVAIPLSWMTCMGAECIANHPALSDAVLAEFGHGKTAHLRFTALHGRDITLELTLRDLDTAMATLAGWAGRKGTM
ncbi:invasion associated locus B family protein [Komagataeibacter diospyri]|uniref:invasion associated locus B family protein n=1 Tax=Komagataeibacter diospyri TaxID=1932662 RepID=UPI00113B7DA7|nr:invasion associated locus B family protein [Komagataeibacter diospyri]GCE91474.1 invasion protein B [Komagataeibacter diospyri]